MSSEVVKLALFGAAGRMGRTVVRLAAAESDLSIVGAIDAAGSEGEGQDVGQLAGAGNAGVQISPDLASGLLGADVVIDFSVATAVPALLRAAERVGTAVVSGTTRLDDDCLRLLDRVSATIPVLWAPNMSVGVYVLTRLVRDAVRMLGPEYDVEITETHHGAKVDAPSGTATQLLAAAQQERATLEPVFGRHGETGARPASQIGVHALRGGAVIGDHSVHLLGARERIEITHRAITRDLFAAGALRAARFIKGMPAGRYGMGDVIG